MSNSTDAGPQRGTPPWVLPAIVGIVAIAAVAIALIVTNDSSTDSSSESSSNATVAPAAAPADTTGSDDADTDTDSTAGGAVCPEFTNTDELPLMLCDSGELVLSIQGGLTIAGFPVEADGFYGPATEQAITAFQQSQGLEADGIYGPDTEAALEAVVGGS